MFSFLCLVSSLFAAPIPTLVNFMKCLPLVYYNKCILLLKFAYPISFFRSNPQAIELLGQGDILGGFNAFNWSQPGIVQGLEDSILHNGVAAICQSETVSMHETLCDQNRCTCTDQPYNGNTVKIVKGAQVEKL